MRPTGSGGSTSAAAPTRVTLPAGDPISIVLVPDRGDDWLFGVSASPRTARKPGRQRGAGRGLRAGG